MEIEPKKDIVMSYYAICEECGRELKHNSKKVLQMNIDSHEKKCDGIRNKPRRPPGRPPQNTVWNDELKKYIPIDQNISSEEDIPTSEEPKEEKEDKSIWAE